MNIILVDNGDQHIYKDRHYLLYDQLIEKFPDKQILMTTHSAVLVGFKVGETHTAGYVPEKYLYDVDKYQYDSWDKIIGEKSDRGTGIIATARRLASNFFG